MIKCTHIIIIAIALFLQGCSSSKNNSALTPMPQSSVIDPTNKQLKDAMLNFLKQSGAPISSTYNFVRYDLNGDKRRDAVIVIKSPYGYWCGTHGCVMLVMKAHNNGFTLVNSIQPIREPIFLAKSKTNGWNNIIVKLSGRMNEKAKNVMLRYNGRTYPKDPSNLAPYPINPATHPDFRRILYNDGL